MRQAARYHDGQIQWRGPEPDQVWFYKSRKEAEDIARAFRLSATQYPWFKIQALEYARQLDEAIKQFDQKNAHEQV